MKGINIIAVVLIVIGFVIASCMGPVGPVGPSGDGFDAIPDNARILLNENFESYAVGNTPTGWTRANAFTSASVYHVVTNTASVSYNRSLMVQGFASFYNRQIVKAPLADSITNTLSGKIRVSFYANKSNADKAKGFVFYINQIEKFNVVLNQVGFIDVYTSTSNAMSVKSYNANEWIKLDVVLNLNTQTYSLYVENILRAENIPCPNTVEQLNTGSGIFDWQTTYPTFFGVLTNIDINYALDKVFIDNVLIYYIP